MRAGAVPDRSPGSAGQRPARSHAGQPESSLHCSIVVPDRRTSRSSSGRDNARTAQGGSPPARPLPAAVVLDDAHLVADTVSDGSLPSRVVGEGPGSVGRRLTWAFSPSHGSPPTIEPPNLTSEPHAVTQPPACGGDDCYLTNRQLPAPDSRAISPPRTGARESGAKGQPSRPAKAPDVAVVPIPDALEVNPETGLTRTDADANHVAARSVAVTGFATAVTAAIRRLPGLVAVG